MKLDHADAVAGGAAHALTDPARARGHAAGLPGPAWVQWLAPVAVFGAGVALSLLASLSARDQTRLDTQSRFDASAANAALQFERRFVAYTDVLVGMRALFYTVPSVSREDFRRYTQALALERGYPGFEVLNYAQYVAAESKEAFEEAQRRDQPSNQGPRFAIHPAGVRADYYPITRADPPAEHLALLGRDLGAMPAARATLEASRDSGALSASVIRPQGPGGRIGLAIRLPVYRGAMPVDSVEQRRIAYLGTVGAGIWMDEMLAALPGVPGTVRLRLFDGGPEAAAHEPAAGAVMPPGKLLFDTHPPGTGPQAAPPDPADAGSTLRSLQTFRHAGKLWLVEASAPVTGHVGPLDRMVPALILIGGGLISALLAGVVFSLTGSKRRATELAHAMTRSLRSSQQQLAAAQALARQGSWVLDVRSGEIECSDEANRIYGFLATERKPTLERLLALMPELQRGDLRGAIERARRTGASVELEHRVHGADGSERWVHLNLRSAAENGVSTVSATVRDETTRKRSALRLALAHDIARELAGSVEPEGAVAHILSSIGEQLGWHAALCWGVDDDDHVRCLGAWALHDDASAQEFAAEMRAFSGPRQGGNLDAAWAAGNPLWRVIPLVDVAWARDRVAGRCGLQAAVVVPVMAGKQLVALEFFSRVLLGVDREIEGFMRSIASQLAQYLLRKQAESALRHVASHDALTGLVNRALLQERLTHALRQAARQEKVVAVLFVDLDRFKHVNDSLGHGAGDVLLRVCAARLCESVRDSDTVARFGGDEFVLVLEGLNSVADVMAPLGKVLSRLGLPLEVEGHVLRTTASIGISMFPADGIDVESLLAHADAAMYRAKEAGPGQHHFYSARMNAQSQERLALETALPQALARGQLFMVYQPKQALADGAITGVEALMRWRHPTLGLVSPLQFIPVAEAIGLIDGLGHWALQIACGDARRWQDQGHAVQVSVNLSPRQLDRPRLAEEVAQVLADAGLAAGRLELEITESGVMRNPMQAAARLHELRELGVSLAIDDFGTGYSSLSYLRTFPLSTLKIDRSFVKDLPADEDAAALTAGIIALAHRLRLVVVAEGVETVEQRDCLQAGGCDQIQGYLLSMPMAAREMETFLRTRSAPALASSVPMM